MASAALIDWGSAWNGSSANLVVDGITVTLTTAPLPITTIATDPILHVKKQTAADQTFTITFSESVNFSQGFGDLNASGEAVKNFSESPSSVAINANHTWDGSELAFNGSAKSDFSTLTWSGIVSLSFDHVFPNAAELQLLDADVSASRAAVPEPGSLAIFAFGAIGLAGVAARRRKNRSV